jgi:hypothetical protein
MDGWQGTTGTRFAVDLGDVQLPPMTVKVVEAEIRSVVLRALAEVDFGGQRAMERHDWAKFPGGIAGGIWGPITEGDWPWPLPGSEGDEELSPQDHTLIMRAIMAHPFEVIANLDDTRNTNPSGTEVLEAALQVGQIDPYSKSRMRAVLGVLPRIEEARSRAPAKVQRSLDELQEQLTGRSIQERARILRDSKSRYGSRDGMSEGMEMAARILEDGASSIYSPEHGFYRMLREGKRKARKDHEMADVADADGIGATAGGVAGSLIGGVGAGPGAVAGGAGASAGYVVGAVIDWLFFD